jgi:hypothetical protein
LVLLSGAFGAANQFLRQENLSAEIEMMELNYLTEIPSSCGPEDVDFTTFVEATSLIGDHDAVEEFLACGLWPLGE